MFKLAVASLFSAMLGGLVVLVLQDAPAVAVSPVSLLDQHARCASEQRALASRLDDLQRQVDLLEIPVVQMRTEVPPAPPIDLDALVARVDQLAQEVARLHSATVARTEEFPDGARPANALVHLQQMLANVQALDAVNGDGTGPVVNLTHELMTYQPMQRGALRLKLWGAAARGSAPPDPNR